MSSEEQPGYRWKYERGVVVDDLFRQRIEETRVLLEHRQIELDIRLSQLR